MNNLNLTNRESEITMEIVRGAATKEIAAKLFISIQTVNTHIKNIKLKTNAKSLAHLAGLFIVSLGKDAMKLYSVIFLLMHLVFIVPSNNHDVRKTRTAKVRTSRTRK